MIGERASSFKEGAPSSEQCRTAADSELARPGSVEFR